MKISALSFLPVTVSLGLSICIAPVAAAADWVEFHSATTPPSPFKVQQAEAKGQRLEAEMGEQIRGQLFRPNGKSPAPAVVMVHGCQGLQVFQQDWARIVASWGYVVLLVDGFGPRRIDQACTIWNIQEESARVTFDAYGALQHLATLAFVDPTRIAAMGWSTGGFLNIVQLDGVQHFFDRKFRAAIAFYPNCRMASTGRFSVPLLVLVGDMDDWSLADDCRRMARAGRGGPLPIEVIVYPGTFSGFDDPAAGAPHMEDYANLQKTPARGVTLGYDADAHEDAIERVRAFLASTLRDGE